MLSSILLQVLAYIYPRKYCRIRVQKALASAVTKDPFCSICILITWIGSCLKILEVELQKRCKINYYFLFDDLLVLQNLRATIAFVSN